MVKKLIIDCDPGIDDAIALCMALFDPRLDVLAITSTAGNVESAQAIKNVQTIVESLDPPRWPRLGTAPEGLFVGHANAKQIHGNDGLGNFNSQLSKLHHQHPSEKVITDVVRNAPGQVTVLCLGPLTNLALAFSRDPDLASMIDRVVIMGGSISGVGNVTATAEYNMFCDPESAQTVFRSLVTKTLVPLEVSQQLTFNLSMLDELPDASTRAGNFLRNVLQFLFRSYRQVYGLEGIHLHDVVALIAALHPEFFETQDMAGDVETNGSLTRGATVFDRRSRPEWRINLEVAMKLDKQAVRDAIRESIRYAGQLTR